MEKTNAMREFEAICAVPRRSFHNEKIIEYCIEWARDHGLDYTYDDKNNNVIIRKPAASGKEDHDGIILQGHLDMVAQTVPGTEHDWDNEGIDFYIDGDLYRAKGTTLGADNGVAAAIGFALLSDDTLNNPPLELLLTTDEEVGMLSVKNADLTFLKGKNLLNLDCGPEGAFTVGCAGGCLLKAQVPHKKEPVAESLHVSRIEIGGLKGGHSGIMITQERANAIKILGRLVNRLRTSGDVRICDIICEGKDNAISDNAVCVVACDADTDMVAGIAAAYEKECRYIYREADPDLYIKVSEGKADEMLCDKENDSFTNLLHLLPFGVQHFEQTLKAVESSVNLGLTETDDEHISIYISLRSSVQERMDEMCAQIRSLCALCGAQVIDEQKSYPAWTADFDSPFLNKVSGIYREMYGTEPQIVTTHGGLECGYILANSNIESAIAIGPDSEGEHTTEEELSISSFNRVYEFTRKVIEHI